MAVLKINQLETHLKNLTTESKQRASKHLLNNLSEKIKAELPESLKNKIKQSEIKEMVEKQKMAGNSLEDIVENYSKVVVPLVVDEMEKYFGNNLDKEGLAYAAKSLASLKTKVEREWGNLTDDSKKEYKDMINFTKQTVKDAIRFTINTTMETFYDDWKKAIKTLKSNGYKCIKVSNTWLNKNSTYFGVNMSFESPFGYIVEIQMHTPEDKKVWHETHEMYEAGRTAAASRFQKEISAKAQKMVIKHNNLDKLKPKGIQNVNLENANKL